jgi:hypothetical protein
MTITKPMANKRKKKPTNAKKQDISLMTLLANESTSDSRKILKKYGNQDASDHLDLETKLAQLYFSSDDKVQLEKKLANIHPHKNWILKWTEPVVVEKEVVVEEVKSEPTQGCGCGNCSGNARAMNEMMSGFDSSYRATTEKEKNVSDYMLGLVGVIGIITMGMLIATKNK